MRNHCTQKDLVLELKGRCTAKTVLKFESPPKEKSIKEKEQGKEETKRTKNQCQRTESTEHSDEH